MGPRHPYPIRSILCTLCRLMSGCAVAACGVSLSACYAHVRGGPAVASRGDGWGGLLVASSGINGQRGGVGLHSSALLLPDQKSGTLGVEAFRLWRSPTGSGFRPYIGGALGLLELGAANGELLVGGANPKLELGLMALGPKRRGLTLSLTGEARFRADGLSTPVFGLQLGLGSFDYVDAPPKPPATTDLPEPAGEAERRP